MRLESRELNETPESRAELQALAEDLRGEGFEVSVAEQGESVNARLQEGVDATTIDVLNIVLDEAARFAIDVVVAKVREWARRRQLFGLNENDHEAQPVGVIWGPDGRDVLRVVELPSPGSNLTADERRVLGGLLGKPGASIADKTVDAVAARIDMNASDVRRTLAQLATQGLVRQEVDAKVGIEFWIVLEAALQKLEGAIDGDAGEP